MTFMLRQWRLPLAALMAALGFTLAAGTQAFASPPGEGSVWNSEIVNGQQVRAGSEVSQARDTSGNLVEVWRGYDQNTSIYISVNHGPIEEWPLGVSYTAPRVIWTSLGFRVFHTGTSTNMYYAGLTISSTGNLLQLGYWVRVPNNAVTNVDRPPAVTALPQGGMYLAWRGLNQDQLYGMYYDGISDQWRAPVAIAGARSPEAPALAYTISTWQQLVMVFRGTDNQVNIAFQSYGSGTWSAPAILPGITADDRPSVAITPNGRGQVAAIRAGGDEASLTTIYSDRTYSGWSNEAGGFDFGEAPSLTNSNNTVYMLGNNHYGYVYWKPSGQY